MEIHQSTKKASEAIAILPLQDLNIQTLKKTYKLKEMSFH
jgi:hypothetical protein